MLLQICRGFVLTFVLAFAIRSAGQSPQTVEKIVLHDPLRGKTLGMRSGGRFVTAGGWRVINKEDMIVYDLGRYVENGALTIYVRNFKPSAQNAFQRHHIISMFRNPWGNHQSVENQEHLWDFHTGHNFNPGIKLLSFTDNRHEHQTVVRDDWPRQETHQITMIWHGNQLRYLRNGVLVVQHTHEGPMQLRYLYIGRDRTVSGDYITHFHHNQYFAPMGPIYSDITITEMQPANDAQPPRVQNVCAANRYANAVRLQWTTDEPSVCYVEYGATSAYGEQTPVLGPPARKFETTLARLSPNQTYHYRIVARDDADNLSTIPDQTFTTLPGELYLFKPVADTFVERSGIFGETRDHGNYGFVHLAAGASWECYLRFEIAGVQGEIAHATLCLHGRQSGKLNGILRVLPAAWDEMNVTWLTKPKVEGEELARLPVVQAGQWHVLNVDALVTGNGVYGFALLGSNPEPVSFDSRECTNFQPELIVTASPKSKP
ncbi:MAG: DUF7594 domain-containing protein [bacterium]